jgi:uncharacterized membrane protein YphA (DoxX/SURF4 family)
MYKRAFSLLSLIGALIAPTIASAHEVYVLTANQIALDTSTAPFDMFAVLMADLHRFAFWAFIGILTVGIIFFISVLRPVEAALDPYLMRLKKYAPAFARITVGLGFMVGGYFHASFGPELPLAGTYGAAEPLIALLLVVVGAAIVIGLWARAAAVIAFVLFSFSVYKNGSYMLTYLNYLGEIIVLLLIGSHRASMHSIFGWHEHFHRHFHAVTERIKHLAFPVLRVCFGISLIYASAYAKVIHNNLALQVASLPLAGHPYSLAHYFGFEPQFLVLGAAIVEVVIGLFFVLGIEIRFTSLFLLFWLSLSLWYFGETVWPHIILIGIPIAFILHGYDKYSVEGRFFKKRLREPVF